jgi:ATP-dependent DNA helicase RecG
MRMAEDLLVILHELMNLPTETEWVEFKEAKTFFDFEDIGRYVSALSNEANLNERPEGWLIFGVTDKPPRKIVGSHFNEKPPGLEKLKKKISQHTNHQFSFASIDELPTEEGRVVMFRIPPATRGIPTEWKGLVCGRIHDSLGQLALHKIEKIRDQSANLDWSARICEKATLADLDPDAIAFAREKYKEKHPELAEEVDAWDDSEFLNRMKVCINGQITNTAIILLGKTEAAHYLSPAIAHIAWVLIDKDNTERDYAHFHVPMILAVDHVYTKIRNLTYRYITNETLFPLEVSQYDPWVIREALHNCIAHQDYQKSSRITVTEREDSILFTNRGDFLPGTVEMAIERDSPPEFYRNRFLADAMVELKMIDTIGSGIRRMFKKQRERNFPMPDYDLTTQGVVRVRIIGKVIDEKYTRMLIRRKDLTLMDVVALDKVQKGRLLLDAEFKSLKSKNLVEGRRPKLYVSERVATETGTRVDYIRKRSFNKQHFKDMIVEYLKKFKEADKNTIEDLLMDKVSEAQSEDQKRHFIKNLLQEMRKEGTIATSGGKKYAKWVLAVSPRKER